MSLAPVTRWALSLRRQLHIARAAHAAALGAVARKEAQLRDALYQRDEALHLVVDLRSDLGEYQRQVALLMTTAPSDLREMDL